VGAGPSGLVLALTLAMNGIPLRIIDKELTFRVGAKGAGMMVSGLIHLIPSNSCADIPNQPRAIELYQFLGILPDIQALTRPPKPMRFYAPPEGVKPLKTWYLCPYTEPTPSHPFVSGIVCDPKKSAYNWI
jgi:2-polyprenyl-6-methoxyphenol hydroxylase-like FAD-dependent oxidoreductase